MAAAWWVAQPDVIEMVDDVFDRVLLPAWFALRAARFRATQQHPSGAGRVLRSGADPIRVLVTGAGVCAGYGVGTHEQGLAGSMATELAGASDRGVTVDLTAKPLMPAATAVDRIGLVGAHTYGVAVFSPCYLEDSVNPRGGIDRHGAAIVQHLLATGGPKVQVVLIGVPQPVGEARLDLALAHTAERTNRTMQDLAAEDARVTYVAPPAFGSVTDRQPFDAEYYRRLGTSLAGAVLTVLGHQH